MKTRAAESGGLFLFLALVLGGGLVIGTATAPGVWYATLNKPTFSPPNWIFAPVWTTLYIIIAIVGWRVWREGRNTTAMKVWWAQLALNFVWSPIFFSLHRIDIALGMIVLLLITIIGFIMITWRRVVPVCPLRRLGCVRIGSEWRDLAVELIEGDCIFRRIEPRSWTNLASALTTETNAAIRRFVNDPSLT